MNSKVKLVLGICGFIVLLCGAVIGYNSLKNTADINNIKVAKQKGQVQDAKRMLASDFKIMDSDGGFLKLSDMFGKPIVLNFWASWCPPCREEMPDFEKVYKEIGDEVIFMMVNLVGSRGETEQTGAKFVADNGFTFPVYFDVDQEGSMAYNITSIPTTLFIDKDGYIVTGAQGAIDEATLREGVDLIRDTTPEID